MKVMDLSRILLTCLLSLALGPLVAHAEDDHSKSSSGGSSSGSSSGKSSSSSGESEKSDDGKTDSTTSGGENSGSGKSTSGSGNSGSGNSGSQSFGRSPTLDADQTKSLIAQGKAASMPLLLTYLKTHYPGEVLDVRLHTTNSKYVYEVRYLSNVVVLRTVYLDALTLQQN